MKRTCLKRSRLKRNTPKAKKWLWRAKLKAFLRRTKLNPRGRKYAERREQNFGEKAVDVRRMSCLICGVVPSDAHHEPSRGLGGTSKSLTPLCRRHHIVRHDIGPTNISYATLWARRSPPLYRKAA